MMDMVRTTPQALPVSREILEKIFRGYHAITENLLDLKLQRREKLLIVRAKHDDYDEKYTWAVYRFSALYQGSFLTELISSEHTNFVLTVWHDGTYWSVERVVRDEDDPQGHGAWTFVGFAEDVESMLLTMIFAFDSILPRFRTSCGVLYATRKVAHHIEGVPLEEEEECEEELDDETEVLPEREMP